MYVQCLCYSMLFMMTYFFYFIFFIILFVCYFFLWYVFFLFFFFFFQAEDGIRDLTVTGVQTCALPIFPSREVIPVPPVAMMTCVPLWHSWMIRLRTCAGSSRTIAWPEIVCPAAVSRSCIARPLVSESSVRVSLTVRTKQATEAGPWALCSTWLTLRLGIWDLGFHFDLSPAQLVLSTPSFSGSPSVSLTSVAVADVSASAKATADEPVVTASIAP